jgi:hypothetical protein
MGHFTFMIGIVSGRYNIQLEGKLSDLFSQYFLPAK